MDNDFDAYFENDDDNEAENYSDDDDEEEDEKPNNVNPEYELEREEPESKSADEFAKFLHSVEYPDDILNYLKGLKLFQKDEKTSDIVPTKSLMKVISGFGTYLLGQKRIPRPVIKGIAKIFGKYDIFHYICADLVRKIPAVKESKLAAWFNIFNFVSFLSHPTDRVTKPLFSKFCARSSFTNNKMKKTKLTWIANDWDNIWMAIMTANVNTKLSLKLIPYITDNVIQKMKTPFKSADFFFKMFDKTDIHGILSLGAIFKLISEHNFEYPKFYEKVYSLTRPSLLYMDQKEKVLTMLDSFLSSTHIPIYIVASFTKRLSRCLLFAPVDAQEPILGLIKNLVIRHTNCSELVHREVPASLDKDPFDDDENDLHKTRALESSLWEMKLLQSHWNQSVRKRAHFIDKQLQKIESFVRFRCIDELFAVNMSKSFGGDDSEAEKYRKEQDGDNEDEEEAAQPAAKKARKSGGGKFAAKHESEAVKSVGINSGLPKGILERRMVNVDTPILWKV